MLSLDHRFVFDIHKFLFFNKQTYDKLTLPLVVLVFSNEGVTRGAAKSIFNQSAIFIAITSYDLHAPEMRTERQRTPEMYHERSIQ